jgi:YbbR domain-containing protein
MIGKDSNTNIEFNTIQTPTDTKTLFIIPTDAHYDKTVEMLKQFKYSVRTAQ